MATTHKTKVPLDTPPETPRSPTTRALRLERWLSGFSALKVRNFRLFWLGQVVAQTGSWMQTTAQAWLVLTLTSSPFALGLVTTLQFLPIMLLSLISGVFVDRLNKHRLIVVTQVVALVQAAVFGMLVATGTIQLWHVYILAALLGTRNAIDNPARQAFVPEMVGREHLVNAVALNSMLFNGARIIGPAMAGVIIAQFGVAPVMLLSAVSYIAVLIGLLRMNTATLFTTDPQTTGPILDRLKEGLLYVWKDKAVLQIMIVVAAIGTFGYNFSVIMPLLAGFVLNTSAQGFGGLSAFLGVGSLMSALATAYAKNVTMRRLLIGSAGFSVLLGMVAWSTNYALSAGLLIALGFAGIMFSTTANSLLQLTVPDALRGRVMSLYFLLFAGSTPIGSLVIGTLSDTVGVSWALSTCAVLCAAGVLVALVYGRRTA